MEAECTPSLEKNLIATQLSQHTPTGSATDVGLVPCDLFLLLYQEEA